MTVIVESQKTADLPKSEVLLSPAVTSLFSKNQVEVKNGYLAQIKTFPWDQMTHEQEQDQREVDQTETKILNALSSHKNINAQGVEAQLKRITASRLGLDLQESILNDILRRIENNGQCYQEDKNTCSTSMGVDGKLFYENPGLMIKTTIDLIIMGESNLNGYSVKLHKPALRMNDGRTLMSRVLQESFSKFMVEQTPGGSHYDSTHTTWDVNVNGKIIHNTGFFGVQLNKLTSVITGKESHYYRVDDINRNQMANTAIGKMESVEIEMDSRYIKKDSEGNITVDPAGIDPALIDAKTGGMMIMSELSEGGQHSNHFMRVYKFEVSGETYILARNTIKGQENLIMTVDEFEQSLMHFYTEDDAEGLAYTGSIEDVMKEVASGANLENFISIDGVPTYAATRPITLNVASTELKSVAVRKSKRTKYSFEEVSSVLDIVSRDKKIPMQGVFDYQLSKEDLILMHDRLEAQRLQLEDKSKVAATEQEVTLKKKPESIDSPGADAIFKMAT